MINVTTSLFHCYFKYKPINKTDGESFMKKIFIILLSLLSISLFAQTFETGKESTFFPGDITQLMWDDNSIATKCYCTKIKPITDGYYELEFTVPSLSNMTAVGTYPIVVTYIVKKGSIISMNYSNDDDYLEKIDITIKSVEPNKCSYTYKNNINPSKTTRKPSDNSSLNKSEYEDWTINKIELLGKRNEGKKIALKDVQVTLLYKTGKVNLWTKNGSISAAYNNSLYETLCSLKDEYDSDFNSGYGNFYGRIIHEYGNPVFYIDFIE